MSVGPIGPPVDPEDTIVVDDVRDRINALWAMATTAALGGQYVLLDNPVGFILAVVAEFLLDLILGLAGEAGNALYLVWRELAGALGMAGVAAVNPFAELGGMLMGAVNYTDSTLTSVAADLGAPAPFLIIPFWAIVVWALATYGRRAIARVWGAIPWT